jgi:hypothetical protein
MDGMTCGTCADYVANNPERAKIAPHPCDLCETIDGKPCNWRPVAKVVTDLTTERDRLQAQNAQMRDVLVRIGGMMVEPSEMVRLARELVMSTKPVDYHNPADVKRIAELESELVARMDEARDCGDCTHQDEWDGPCLRCHDRPGRPEFEPHNP